MMKTFLIRTVLSLAVVCGFSAHAQSPAPSSGQKSKILVIFGDNIGQTNVSAYSFGMMEYKTLNIDRLAKEGICSLTSALEFAAGNG